MEVRGECSGLLDIHTEHMTVTSETLHPYGRRILLSILAGGLSFLIVAVALIEVLAPYVWPAPLVALPVAIVAGVTRSVESTSDSRTESNSVVTATCLNRPDGGFGDRWVHSEGSYSVVASLA